MRSIFLILAISIFLFSCKKDSTSNPNANSTNRIKAYSETVTSAILGNKYDSFALSYDAEGRLASLKSVTMPIEQIVFTYNSNNSFITAITGDDGSVFDIISYLKDSLVDSTFQYEGVGGDTSTEKYFYNTNKQLIQLNDYTYSVIPSQNSLDDVTLYSYDASGNLLEDSDYNQVETYTYYANLTYTYYANLFLTSDFTLQPFASKQSFNLPKTHNIVSGGINETSNITYTFDSQNRLSSTTEMTNTGDIAIKRYTYY